MSKSIFHRGARKNLKFEILPLLRLVEQTVEDLHAGRITLFALPEEAFKATGPRALRWTPSFVPGRPAQKLSSVPYNAVSLGKYLGALQCTTPKLD